MRSTIGTAGVIIERKRKLRPMIEGVIYGASTMYLMRKVPAFTGDFATGDPKGQATPLADYALGHLSSVRARCGSGQRLHRREL